MTEKTIPLRAWALLGLLALIWGGSFPSNKLALAEFGVAWTVAVRVGMAAALMWIVVAVRGLKVPRAPRVWAGFAALSLINNVLPFWLIVWGQTRIDAGLAAILSSSTAIFGTALAALVWRDERLGPRKGFGLAVGFLGVATAIGLGRLTHLDPASLGQLALIGSSVCYAVGANLGRRVTVGIAPDMTSALMLSISTLVAVPLALAVEGLPRTDLSLHTWGALVYLGAPATACAYMLYYRVLRLAGAGNLTLVTLLVAPVSIGLGAAMFGEVLAPRAWAGFALLALGLLILDGRLLARLAPGRAAASAVAGAEKARDAGAPRG
jgi:drug/metabolite transporter (DMT)-like permease